MHGRPRAWVALTSFFAIGALVATPGDAEASGYLTARFGSDQGAPSHPNAFAIYFNPAALGGTKGTSLTGDVSVLLRFARYHRTGDALSPSNDSFKADQQYINANTGTANLTNLLAVPFLGFNTDFGTQSLRAGWAAYVPFGGMASWDKRSGDPGVPGTVDGVQRWHNISGQILAVYNTFALAYKIAPARLTIGASFSPVVHRVQTVRARNADGSDDTVAAGSIQEGRSLLEATGLNFGASFGLYYEPTDQLRLGLSYISQPGFGETRMSGTLRTQLGSGQESKSDIDFLQTYPDIIRFGAAYRASEKLEIRGDFEFVRWSVFERQCVVEPNAKCAVDSEGKRDAGAEGQRVVLNIPRNWNNAIGVRVGPGYWINEKLEAFGSLGLTTPAVPKESIDASTIDAVRFYFAAGARYEFSKHFALAASYNHIYFLPVDTEGKNNLNIPAHPASAPGGNEYNASRSPSADGKYYSQVGFVNINAAYTF